MFLSESLIPVRRIARLFSKKKARSATGGYQPDQGTAVAGTACVKRSLYILLITHILRLSKRLADVSGKTVFEPKELP
jgi:hypothetical protein